MKYFIDKLGITIMTVDDRAEKGLLAMLETQGWKEFETSYYCKEHGEVKNGLCSCFNRPPSEREGVMDDKTTTI